jgi:hypothetical protein
MQFNKVKDEGWSYPWQSTLIPYFIRRNKWQESRQQKPIKPLPLLAGLMYRFTLLIQEQLEHLKSQAALMLALQSVGTPHLRVQ